MKYYLERAGLERNLKDGRKRFISYLKSVSNHYWKKRGLLRFISFLKPISLEVIWQ